MAIPSSRKFAVLDAIIIVAAIALGLAISMTVYKYKMVYTQNFIDRHRRFDFDGIAADQRDTTSAADVVEQLLPDEIDSSPFDRPSGPSGDSADPMNSDLSRHLPTSPFVEVLDEETKSTGLSATVRDLVDDFRESAVLASVSSCLAACTLGLAVLCLRRPRPDFRDTAAMLRFSPALSAAAALMWISFESAFRTCVLRTSNWDLFRLRSPRDLLGFIGPGIVVAWASLGLSRRFRFYNWLDLMGLCVGLAWTSLWLLVYLRD